ncbi:HpcH/HpaI aldolase/citrate lyase family protein [Gordonia hydrophobica]|uniref:CoA ester lyase n=1 Tax=Gordonia hydrophobica TaxID=40516 RepID=A0ABZ2U6L6_9ACTN|nr:CoA ester lyase [Gordonia hydrophobica]MBM7365705.1 citrate lyase subunit beta/citryl-CoA lyase [Gordonia hydrophobica]
MTSEPTSSTATDLARTATTVLFVPGDRPERFEKAAAAGADLVIIDLEDAVPHDHKVAARGNVTEWVATGHHCAVRINAADTGHFAGDLDALTGLGAPIMLAKAESADVVQQVAEVSGSGVIALIETARGILAAPEIAAVPGVVRLAVGTFDLAAQLGVDPTDHEALTASRGALVLASAAAGLAGPLDGVTAAVDDADRIAADAAHARRLGFAGKLCIHPRQLAPTIAAFAPTDDEVAWAHRIMEAVEADEETADGVIVVAGQMVDKPVIDRAERILQRAT